MRSAAVSLFSCAVLVVVFFLTNVAREAPEALHGNVKEEEGSGAEEKIRATIALMSLEEKVGQLFMVSFKGSALTDEQAAWLMRRHLGGVVLLGGNVVAREQVRELITQLHERVSAHLPAPLFIAADQEGGVVSRFKFFDQRERVAQRDIKTPDEAFALGERRGKLLRELGISIVFSPVLDVAQGPDDFMAERTFRGDAQTVGELGVSLIRGYQAGGVLPSAKHFPGHGGTTIDSHRNLPVVHRDERAWNESIVPFKAAIDALVPIVMSAHVLVPEKDANSPATLSAATLSGVLRSGLGFKGVVITDDLSMGAIAESYSLDEAAIRALDAGADIILAITDRASLDQAMGSVVEAVRKGSIASVRIDESVERILFLKRKITVGR